MQVCNKCNRNKPFLDFYKKAQNKNGYDYTCKICYNKIRQSREQRSYDSRLRLKALSVLGDRCANCGFSDVRALQIDHINGGGNLERRKLGGRHRAIFRKIVNGFVDGYQVLCANCNWIKRLENGETGFQYSQRLIEGPSQGHT